VVNLTTAASIWFSGAIGMAIGFDYYFAAFVSVGFVVIVSRLPRFRKGDLTDNE
jgi:putative Mg2+ transporter-C (MgtC) family protein